MPRRILGTVAPRVGPADGQPVVGGIECVIHDVALQVFGQRGLGDGNGNGLPRADDRDLRDRVAPPVDLQRQLAAVQHAIAAQRPNAHTDPLPHPRAIGRDGTIDRFAARARRRNEAAGTGVEIGCGVGFRSSRILEGKDDGNEECETHVGLCTEPGEG